MNIIEVCWLICHPRDNNGHSCCRPPPLAHNHYHLAVLPPPSLLQRGKEEGAGLRQHRRRRARDGCCCLRRCRCSKCRHCVAVAVAVAVPPSPSLRRHLLCHRCAPSLCPIAAPHRSPPSLRCHHNRCAATASAVVARPQQAHRSPDRPLPMPLPPERDDANATIKRDE